MFLAIDIKALLYTCFFLAFFIISYFIIIASRLETIFKQGSTWQIRTAQVLLSIIIAYFLTSAIMCLVNSLQF